jgi:hypothetical protein
MDHKFLQELENHVWKPWEPTEAEKKAKNQDEEIINDALEKRAKEEAKWRWAASRWNLLNEPNSDPRLSNVLLPFVRMIASTAIMSLTQAHRKQVYKPRQRSDDAKAMLWQSASDHVDSACGMEHELDDFYTNFVVLGNACLEDYVHLPHLNKRTKTEEGWKNESVRDFSRPKIGTRSRSPWQCGFWTGSSDPNEHTPVFFRDFYSYNHFLQEFANVRLPNGSPKYDHCECVKPGNNCFISTEGIEYEPMEHQGVSVITFQDPLRDICRKYANGVLILDMSLREYNRIQKTTLSFAANNHKYDENLRVTSCYGLGETHLLEGLDALYQAIGNLNIDNYKLANTNLVSVRTANGTTALDNDIDFVSGIRLDGDVIVSPLGTVRLGEFSAFKEMIDQWAKWTTKVSFDQLLAENKSKTAFELQQQIRAASQGNEYKIQKLAAGCFKKHAQNRLSFILSDMTVEEYMELPAAEIPMIQELVKKNKASKDDYSWSADGKPEKRIVRQKVTVKNRDIVENYDKNGSRSIDDLQDKGPADHDSEVTVVPEYFWPVEYRESGAVPDIEIEVDGGAERELRFSKMQFLSNFARQRISESANFPDVEELKTNFDGRKIDEELVRSIEGVPYDSVTLSQEVDEEAQKLDDAIDQTEKLLSPTSNAQMAQAPVSVSNIDSGGFGSIGEQPAAAQSPVNAAAAGAFGAA